MSTAATPIERPYILHMFTPGAQMSPFDVNMAADAGWQIITPYCGVSLGQISGLTQDAIFSRGPKGAARTGLFIGGRDVLLATDMLDAARAAMVKPFVVSVFADPSGSYTTAAALVACVEAALKKHHDTDLAGKKVLMLGGGGTVGRIAGVLCARAGAQVALASHRGRAAGDEAAAQTGARFGVELRGASSHYNIDLQAELADTDVVMAVAAAGAAVMSAADLAAAPRLLVAADVNAVPPLGIAGVGLTDAGVPLAGRVGAVALGLGALAIGNIKYQVQQRLLVQMRETPKPVFLGFDAAFELARKVVAESA
jgi:methylene-tetrahydromethanopterin dehydrogenase